MMEARSNEAAETAVAMTKDIVEAFVGHNPVSVERLPQLIREVHQTFLDLRGAAPAAASAAVPAQGASETRQPPAEAQDEEDDRLIAKRVPGNPDLKAKVAAVPVEESVTPDYVVCLEDGAKKKILKKYIRSKFGMSPEEYRARWGLPVDYPLVAPNYSSSKSDEAKARGLGTHKVGRKEAPVRAKDGKTARSAEAEAPVDAVAEQSEKKQSSRSAKGTTARKASTSQRSSRRKPSKSTAKASKSSREPAVA